MLVQPELLTVSVSKINALGRCHQRWWWHYVEGLRTKQKPADALWFGTGIHEALADWYGEGYDRVTVPADYWENWVGDEVRWIKANYAERDRDWFDEPVYEEAGLLGLMMLDEYLEEYGDDSHLEILAIEQPFEIEIVDKHGNVIALFRGKFDGVAIDHKRGVIVLLEHKTATAIKLAHLPLDPQAGSYYAVATIVLRHAGILGKREHIKFIMYNFLRKSKPDRRQRDSEGRYLNKNGSVSKKQGTPMFVREYVDRAPREVNSRIRAIADHAEIMNKLISGELPVTKTINDMCPYCPFYTMCVMHERGGSAWKEFRDAQFTVEEPYDIFKDDLRKSAAS